VTAISNH